MALNASGFKSPDFTKYAFLLRNPPLKSMDICHVSLLDPVVSIDYALRDFVNIFLFSRKIFRKSISQIFWTFQYLSLETMDDPALLRNFNNLLPHSLVNIWTLISWSRFPLMSSDFLSILRKSPRYERLHPLIFFLWTRRLGLDSAFPRELVRRNCFTLRPTPCAWLTLQMTSRNTYLNFGLVCSQNNHLWDILSLS